MSEPLNDILKASSRSFYLSLKILPSPLRTPISLAYLLARTADTIADTDVIPAEQRLENLLLLKTSILVKNGTINTELDEANSKINNIIQNISHQQQNTIDRDLINALPTMIEGLTRQSNHDQQQIKSIVTTLTEGMEMDLRYFPSEQQDSIKALVAEEDLERYIYFVAGCVGGFWTNMLIHYDSSLKHWNQQTQETLGVNLGKALQLTNVLRDVAADLRIGRCYLPAEQLQQFLVTPYDLLDSKNTDKAIPLLNFWIKRSLNYYKDGLKYVLSIPRLRVRLRLSAVWPLLIGLATLEKIIDHRSLWLNPNKTIKVSRPWIYWTILKTLLLFPSNKCMSYWVKAKIATLSKQF